MAEELDPSMLPNWLRDMDDGPSIRPGADDGARYGLTWCGSFTVHGLGFQAMNGTTTDFAMAWPIGNGAWQVLQDAYDIYDPVAGQDGYIETDDLNDIMRENGFRSLNSFTAAKGGGWRESLTRAVAARWCRERYSVPLTFIDGSSSLSRLVSSATKIYPSDLIDQIAADHNEFRETDGLPPFINVRYAAQLEHLREVYPLRQKTPENTPSTAALKEGLARLEEKKAEDKKTPSHNRRPGYFTY